MVMADFRDKRYMFPFNGMRKQTLIEVPSLLGHLIYQSLHPSPSANPRCRWKGHHPGKRRTTMLTPRIYPEIQGFQVQQAVSQHNAIDIHDPEPQYLEFA